VDTKKELTCLRIVSRSFLAITAFGLTACNPSSEAKWVVFHTAPEARIYTDPSTVHKDGDGAQMWVLIDQLNAQHFPDVLFQR
jgi:hypothetical protein